MQDLHQLLVAFYLVLSAWFGGEDLDHKNSQGFADNLNLFFKAAIILKSKGCFQLVTLAGKTILYII